MTSVPLVIHLYTLSAYDLHLGFAGGGRRLQTPNVKIFPAKPEVLLFIRIGRWS
jgi:hypothetical protein